jgi:hypothetical protein
MQCTLPLDNHNRLVCIVQPVTADQQQPERRAQLQPTVQHAIKTRQQITVLR